MKPRRALLSYLLVAASGACFPMLGAYPQSNIQTAPNYATAPEASMNHQAETRTITFNTKPATAKDLEILSRFERAWGVMVPSGDYWYDNKSGAAGLWGGPTRGFLGAGLGLGGELPANASGGGDGYTTGVFINGRELHPLDVQGLTSMLGQAPWPGSWWVDAQGNFGMQGQMAVGNLFQLAAQRNGGKGGNSYYKSDIGTGSSTFVGSGCAAVHARTNPSSSDSSTYSYYVGC
jgi:hypothetical protein